VKALEEAYKVSGGIAHTKKREFASSGQDEACFTANNQSFDNPAYP
jgi:hypothetical protein